MVNDIFNIVVIAIIFCAYYFVVVKHSRDRWRLACAAIKSYGNGTGAIFIASGIVWIYLRPEAINGRMFLVAQPYGENDALDDRLYYIEESSVTDHLPPPR